MGVVWQYPQGEVVPEGIVMTNEHGGMHWDVDRFGVEVPTRDVVTSGEFPLSKDTMTEEHLQKFCGDMLRAQREVLEKRWQKKESMEAIMQMRRALGIEVPPERIADLEHLNYAIAEVEAEILRYQSRLDNNDKDLPFTIYLQLTIMANREIQSIERLQYTRDLGSAMNYLIRRLLSKPMNYVNQLRIMAYSDRDCFWFPVEIKLTARHLMIDRYYEEVMRSVGRFFRRINCRPFQSIGQRSIQANYIGGNYTEAVTINQIDPSLQIGTIPHSRLHFDFCAPYERFIGWINYWETNGAPIGTYYTANTNLECFGWYNNMRRRAGITVAKTPTRGCECITDCLILPLPNNAQLEFYITPIGKHPLTLLLNFEVQPRK